MLLFPNWHHTEISQTLEFYRLVLNPSYFFLDGYLHLFQRHATNAYFSKQRQQGKRAEKGNGERVYTRSITRDNIRPPKEEEADDGQDDGPSVKPPFANLHFHLVISRLTH